MIQPIAIEKYCDALKDRIIFDKFNRDLFITGDVIKNLTPVPQINSFVIKIIFDKWQKETEKLKSPYFNYENEDVKLALQDFLKKLSFHIKINKDYFEILLKEALRDAFDYLENPHVFLQNEIFDFKGNSISYKEIKSRTKFLKLYPNQIQAFLQHPKINQDEVRVDVFVRVLEEEFKNVNKLEEEKLFVDQISKVVPNNFINLTETKPAFERVDKKRNFIDDLEFEGIGLELTAAVIPEKVIEEEKIQDLEVIDHVLEIEDNTHTTTVESKPTINAVKSTNLAPIERFDDGISLQQKFYFLKELFDEEEHAFIQAVKIADTKPTFDEACDYLWETYSQQFNWANKEDATAEFLSILGRKF